MPDSDGPASPDVCVAIAVVEHEGRFLIGQRPPGVPLAGLWGFPGGKVEPGESPAQAAARECLEETGVEVEIVRAYDLAIHEYPHGRVELHFFHCHPRQAPPQPKPPFQWQPRNELTQFEFPAANQAVLRRIVADN